MKFFWQRENHTDRPSAFSASSFSASSFSASSMALLMVAPPAAVASDQAKLSVSATILKHASLNVVAQPSSVVVTEADIERGYVDVPVPAQVAIKSNSSSGYMLEFANQGDFMRRIVVRGLSTEVQLSPAGGAIMQPPSASGITRATLDLGFRFMLAESAQAGTYSWPVHLSVTPL